MSRLIITNLPTKISNEDIKKHFSSKGSITDVKLVYKNGNFRRYGFVGYEKEEDAQKACSYFNDTYIKQAKITVELCQELKDGSLPMSWREKNELRKKSAKAFHNNNSIEDGSLAISEKETNKKNKNAKDVSSLLKPHENDHEFKEFMKSNHRELNEETPSRQVPIEEKSIVEQDSDKESDQEDFDKKTADRKDLSDTEYLKSLMVSSKSDDCSETKNTKKTLKNLEEHFQVVIRTKERCKIRQKGSVTFTKQSVREFLKPLKCASLRIPPKTKFVAYAGFKTERDMRRALQKHKSFLNGARVQVLKYSKVTEETDLDVKDAPWQGAEEKLKKAESVAESGKLFVRNLWYSVTEDDIRERFEQYGKVSEISLPICKITRRPKGFATVMFLFPEHSVRARNELDGKSLKGRVLHILPAHDNESEDKGRDGESFKDKKAREEKAKAGSWHNWNSLFLGSSAVIDVMAEKYNKSKQEILNAEGKQSVAVNLALGESQIVDETRRFLEDNGIALDAFTSPGVQRSSTVMLVKNLPANTTAQELSQVFSKYGELGRVILPPSGVSGIVEYLDPGEAKKGFRSLAYSKFRYLPLYLEWAPQRVFTSKFVPSKVKNKPSGYSQGANRTDSVKDIKKQSEKESKMGPNSLQDPEPDTTLYIKNLNFTTTEEVLKEHFKNVGPVHSALISKKRGLSQGYGFVQFVQQAHTQKALREMQESLLEDKYLQLKLSEKVLATPSANSARMMHDFGKQTSTKILVKNIPFEATRKEVYQLFGTFGELKTVRLPNKPGTQDHRGFGFVDFVTREGAKKAFEVVCHSTHLYGRRLVLEWAKDDDSVEELRKKTAEQFLAGGPPLKKKKISDALDSYTQVDEDD